MVKILGNGIADPMTDDKDDELHVKYRVFREPETDTFGRPFTEHPVQLIYPPTAVLNLEGTAGGVTSSTTPLVEVPDFIFVLKPDTDPHARTAIAAYAWSVMGEKPNLANDLLALLSDWTPD